MTSNENTNDYCCKNASNIKFFMSSHPIISTGAVTGSILTTASIISPNVRKFTVPLFKSLTKHQLKLFAGLGLLSIANYIANNPEFSDDTEEIIL
ncbi:hypothetical protein CHF27_000480 [Romboutsia maritimum]|uniref:Uncharacterized protein n=1 Tax=Romboutsia maritimum TaxID=2020948 RepID=A0A371IW56_9FIRM|nr:hypothetical protein [Romboutsia maritimum]RDY24709.1 hypothetical protein CHF27_000480 [Romboutsia maritimum]